MNPRDNPYTPGAGTAPLVLVGRDEYVTEVSIGLDRLRRGLSARPTLFTGWRGMGKTVLLDRLSEVARGAGWVPVSAEVAKGVEFGPRMAQLVRKALLQAAPPSKWKESSARAARTLRSFNIKLEPDGSLTAGLGVDPLAGSADSGILTDDLVDLFEALGEALLEHGSGVVFILDELHALTEESLGALATALHAVNRRQLPVTLIGAGLPQVRRQLAEAQSYSERLFSFHDVGLLPDVAAGAVLADPSDARGLPWEPQAVAAAVDWCAGYPYFLQELGSLVWDRSDGPTVLEGDVTDALPVLLDRLDEGFFRLRAERATAAEMAWMHALAKAGKGPHPAEAIAEAVGKTAKQASALRNSLLGKGLVHVPAPGQVEFTVPRFDEYLVRRGPGESLA